MPPLFITLWKLFRPPYLFKSDDDLIAAVTYEPPAVAYEPPAVA